MPKRRCKRQMVLQKMPHMVIEWPLAIRTEQKWSDIITCTNDEKTNMGKYSQKTQRNWRLGKMKNTQHYGTLSLRKRSTYMADDDMTRQHTTWDLDFTVNPGSFGASWSEVLLVLLLSQIPNYSSTSSGRRGKTPNQQGFTAAGDKGVR